MCETTKRLLAEKDQLMAKLAHLQELKKSTPLDPKQERYDAVLQELEVLRMSNPSMDPDYQKKKEKLLQEKKSLFQYLEESPFNSLSKSIAKIRSRLTAIQLQIETTEKKRETKVRENERKKRLTDETVMMAVQSLNACRQRLKRYEERVREVR